MMFRYLFPLLLVGGGVALAVSSAKADAKKKKIDEAFDLGLDDVDTSEPPLPPAMTRALPTNPINHNLFKAWWMSSGYPEQGIMGFWTELDGPLDGTDWILPNANYFDVIITTGDGALWVYSDGWHPAPDLAAEYDAWYVGGAGGAS